MYPQGWPYCDAEGSSQFISCLHDTIINADPRIGQRIDKFELYRQCPPRRANDTNMTELEKCDCVSYVMTIVPIIKIDREKMGAMTIMQVIYDAVYVFVCRVYLDVFKKYTLHAFVYDSHFEK